MPGVPMTARERELLEMLEQVMAAAEGGHDFPFEEAAALIARYRGWPLE